MCAGGPSGRRARAGIRVTTPTTLSKKAGYEPEVIKSYGLAILPGPFNATEGRREAKRLTGRYTVPVLVTDAGDVVADSKKIVVWARDNQVPSS
jgi:hypothetical protein